MWFPKVESIRDTYDNVINAAIRTLDRNSKNGHGRRNGSNGSNGHNRQAYQTVNPYDGNTLQSYDRMTDAEVSAAVNASAACFKAWRTWTFAERAEVMSKASELMHARTDSLARIMTVEMGKRTREAREEVEFSARILEYYAQNAQRFLAPTKLHPNRGDAHLESTPLGVIFAVEPWNFPYYQLARVAGPQLMAGNTLLIKPSNIVPQCATAFEALLGDAGAPDGLYTNLLISHKQAERVIDDPRIKGVALTGSVTAGRSIASRAGQNLKVSSMELGGSDAFIVLEDADLEKAIAWAVWGRMFNTGQACCAAKRFIVVEEVADKFLAGFQAALGRLMPGDPLDETTTLGPMSSEAALLELLAQVRDAVSYGAKVVIGGDRIDRPGSFMQPTILTDVRPGNPAFRQEFFGPVALFFKVKSEAAAIALANDSDFGLGGSVFTRDIERGRRVASQIDTGMMFINNMDWSDAELPFGGIKNSGYGRELGESGIQEFVNRKLVRTAALEAPRA